MSQPPRAQGSIEVFSLVASLFRRLRRQSNVDPLLEFASEADAPRPAPPAGPLARIPGLWALPIVLLIVLAVASSAVLGRGMFLRRSEDTPVRPATLSVTTTPTGAQVTIDGTSQGVTPLTTPLAPGEHAVSVRLGAHERTMRVNARPGGDIARDVQFAIAAAPDAAPTAETPAAASRRPEPGIQPPTAGGWVRVMAPFAVQLVEHGEVVGTSDTPRMMLPAGRHDVLIVNRLLGFEEPHRLDVRADQTATLRIEQPSVSININARPWADVSVDGTPLGQTPIANARVAVGTRKLVFRHPQFGEREQSVVVTTAPGQRISIDFTK